jgi:hypothetical protein
MVTSRTLRRSKQGDTIMQFIIHSPDGKESVTGDAVTLDSLCQAMAEKYGSVGRIETVEKPMSTWAEQVTDEQAKARIEAQHAALNASGVAVDSAEQFYATGTRMADIGYQNQAARKREHEAKGLARDKASELASIVLAEKRRDIETTAAALARQIKTNGKLTAGGFALNEQAIRGLLARCESPALGYVLGIRDRIRSAVAVRDANPDQRDALQASIGADKERLAETLRHELAMAGSVSLKMRVRESRGDCYAIVSPSYVPADAPEVLAGIVDDLPRDARATYAYDAVSTTWELRASVWTPTPVAEQAVGEAFEGYVSFRSRDNGAGAFRGGGGVILIRCLNASTYEAASSEMRRRHTGAIMVDVAAVLKHGMKAIDALCQAWGVARAEVIDVPAGLKLQDVIPDFWSSMLTQRQYAFAGLLPGRTKEHAKGLTEAYFAERREPNKLVRSDMAQAWTRYIQEQPAGVRREAEAAAGAWLVGGRMPRLSESVSPS